MKGTKMKLTGRRLAVGALVVAVFVLLLKLDSRFSFFGSRKPIASAAASTPHQSPVGATPVEPDSYAPAATGEFTNVPFVISGPGEASIQYVDFKVEKLFKTPPRPIKHEEEPTIPVVFSLVGYNPQTGIVRFDLPTPKAVSSGQQPTVLKVGLVASEYPGWTYSGTLSVHFANGKSLSAKNVELDILSKPPSPKSK
jgi:hypothetical protein